MTRTIRTRRRHRLVGAFLFAPLLFFVAVSARQGLAAPAQSEPALGGYTIDTRGTGLRVGYDVPGSLPVGPIVDVGAPEAQARLATGPVGNAISSLAYPGSLVLGLGPLLAAGGDEPPVDLPEYPLIVEASSAGTTEATDEVAPGSVMYAKAEENTVEALTTMAGAGEDAVFSFGGSESRARGAATDVVDAVVEVEMSDVVALAGLLQVESVVTTLVASSDAAAGSSSGGTVVTGASFAGRPITIGPDGVAFEDPPDGGDSPGAALGGVGAAVDPASALLAQITEQAGSLDDALEARGIAIRLAEPRVVEAGPTAERASEGLVIEFDQELGDSEIADVFDLIPLLPDVPGAPIGPNDLVQIIQARQVSSLSIAAGRVAVSASPAFDLPPLEFVIDTTPPAQLPSSGGAAPGFASGGAAAVPGLPTTSTGGTGDITGAAPLAAEPLALPTELGLVGVILAVVGAWVMTLGSRRLPEWAIDGVRIDSCELEAGEGD